MGWRERFPILDRHIDRIGSWATVIGVVWAATTWAASYITPLAAYGWGIFVFVGLGAACLVSLVLSVGLVAWGL